MKISPQFTISEQLFEDCTTFAKRCVETNWKKYATRKQINQTKLINDIRNGKIAEQKVWEQVSDVYTELTPPDYEIYDIAHKSWATDLYDPNTTLSLACKAQSVKMAEEVGYSWVFQYGDGNKDCDQEIFGAGKTNRFNFACFVSTDAANRRGEIKAIVSVPYLHQHNLFKEMKLEKLRDNKRAVYLEDLEKLNNLWQL
jgi:hypothetical protein